MTSKIKVAHIETGENLYGGALQVLYLLTALKEKTISCLAAPATSGVYKAAQRLGITCFPVNDAGDFSFTLKRQCKAIFKKFQPDVVHVHSRRGADIFGGLAARSVGVPAILSRRVDNPPNVIWTVAQHHCYQKVVCISPAIQAVLEKAGLPPSRLTTIYSGVNTQIWKPIESKHERLAVRESLGIPEGATFMITSAQFIPRKGHLVLLQAFAQLAKRDNCQLLLYGKGPLEGEVQDKIKELGLSANVRLMGFSDSLHRILPAADLIIHPVYREGLGVSLLQAAAAKVPILATKAGGINDVFTHQETAFLVEPGSAEELLYGINAYQSEVALFTQYAQNAYQLALKEFRYEQMSEKNLQLYHSVIAEARSKKQTIII